MDKKRRELIENAFRSYRQNKDRIKDLKEGLTASLLPGMSFDKVSVQSSPKNMFEEKMIKAIDEEERLLRWIRVVDYTLIKYQGEYKDKLIIALYFDCLSINRAAYKLHIDRKTVFRWKDEILASAESYAISLRILR